ncbi:MAG: hypothetical protein PF487_03525 [Bacteroidales bacterium]|nr:hypothetical protein [Bacteroidales bacterium]
MNKLEIIDYLNTDNKTGSKSRENHIKKRFPDLYVAVINIDFINSWYEKLYCFLNNIDDIPTCQKDECLNNVNFGGYSKGYYKYCSVKCRNSDIKVVNNNKKIFFEKYGVDNPMKLDNIKDKSKKTKKKRYGDENFNNIIKCKETKKNLYNDEFYSNREQARLTSLENHGCVNYTNRNKAKQTSLDRYGDEFYNNREQARLTSLDRYSVNVYNNREQARLTSLDRYGETSYMKTDEYKNKLFLKTIKNLGNKLNISINCLKYDGSDYIINNYCEKHETFKINRYVLKNRLMYHIENICTKCNPISEQSSIKENEISEFISSLNVKYVRNNRNVLNGKELDIYVPEHNVGIEFNGLYWHSNINIERKYHLNKTDECEQQDIQLLHIFENEWIYKKEIVKSIIKSKLGLIENKIFARKTEIREIDNNKLIRDFLETNHIQGFVGSSVKIGLFYNNDLVSIMTFGKKRLSMGNKLNINDEYEMLRFCNKLNTSVIGGASKLLKYFIKTYSPKSILTFADRRYSQGKLYEKLSFEFIGNTEPNYWYFKAHEYILHYRFKFRKDVLVKEGYDPTKTEQQIMAERDYNRIYDSGNMKFKLILE